MQHGNDLTVCKRCKTEANSNIRCSVQHDSLSEEFDIGGLERCETCRAGRKEMKKRKKQITQGTC